VSIYNNSFHWLQENIYLQKLSIMNNEFTNIQHELRKKQQTILTLQKVNSICELFCLRDVHLGT
jgi:hypothetical protein